MALEGVIELSWIELKFERDMYPPGNLPNVTYQNNLFEKIYCIHILISFPLLGMEKKG